MLKALALFDEGPRYVNRAKALQGGRCYFCGQYLNNHPQDKDGNVLLNRHHEINGVYSSVYQEVTGEPYPPVQQNLFWAGLACHADYHRRLDPYNHTLSQLVARRKRTKCPERLAEIHQELKQVLVEFLGSQAKHGSGRLCLTRPSALPNWRSFAAAA